jgi:hypothetical protein
MDDAVDLPYRILQLGIEAIDCENETKMTIRKTCARTGRRFQIMCHTGIALAASYIMLSAALFCDVCIVFTVVTVSQSVKSTQAIVWLSILL